MADKWWQEATIYQIYPRSFKDSNGDGKGDLPGILEKLPYLKELGIDVLWINPVYASPMVDNGYDISDYYAINPEFGTLDDLRELLKQAHALGLKVIMDLVVNHTSNQHPWFKEARKSKDNPYRDYYLWQAASPDKMPNNWKSFQGTSAWTYDEKTQEAYFHIFDAKQPDLNWKNPRLRQEIYQMIAYWLDFGLDGFRLDAISHLQKEPWDFQIKSWEGDGPWAPFMNVKGIESYMTEIKAIFDHYGALSVGEASGVTSQEAPAWTDAETGFMTMIIEWEHNRRTPDNQGDVAGLIAVFKRWQEDLSQRGWNALYLENHDIPRIISAFGDASQACAKAFAVAYSLLRGTPFIFQGQELGMTNGQFESADEIDSNSIKLAYQDLLEKGMSEEDALTQATQWSRDHARLPMQWDCSPNAGFTTGQPWMKVNDNYKTINVQAQLADKDSLFHLYQRLIELRHQDTVVSQGTFQALETGQDKVFAYHRHLHDVSYLVIVNLSGEDLGLDLSDLDLADWQEVALFNRPLLLKSELTLPGYDYHVYCRSKN